MLFNTTVGLFFPQTGCGGGCCQQSSCGFGRKKRNIIEPIVFKNKDVECPQKKWRDIILQNLSDDIEESEKMIQEVFYGKFHEKAFVSCTEAESLSFTSNGHGFCGAGNGKIYCYLIALLE
uniref:Ground-like domain-containing protein n=1 Tax=Strongyloides papillosus TaxID=174720 RepID=A0A0N5B4C1_STREA